MQDDMADLLDMSNEVQEALGRSYGIGEEIDEADLDAEVHQRPPSSLSFSCMNLVINLAVLQLEALGDDLFETELADSTYLDEATAMPSAPTTAPIASAVPGTAPKMALKLDEFGLPVAPKSVGQ